MGRSDDIPAFEGFFDYSKIVAGSSILAADLICKKDHNIVLNWMGGLHHAKKAQASGFCYINDIVLSILHLLETYDKVLYVDIDVHHGDGVQEAFWTTNRVMTVSFHLYDPENHFFPGTGDLSELGDGEGRHYSLNVPLKAGCTDTTYKQVFESIMDRVFDYYRPDVVFLQCGADSLIGDILGQFNLSILGHAEAVSYIVNKGYPVILSGGGGYVPENVARCWAFESSLMLGKPIGGTLPDDLVYMNEYTDQEFFYNPPNYHNIKRDMNQSSDIVDIIKTCAKAMPPSMANPSIQDRFMSSHGKEVIDMIKKQHYILDSESEEEMIYEFEIIL